MTHLCCDACVSVAVSVVYYYEVEEETIIRGRASEDHNYKCVDNVIYITAEEVTVEDNREKKEEEEFSDDEDDYDDIG